MAETPRTGPISTKIQRIAELAKQAPGMAFTSLAHYIDYDWLLEAYRRTRKDGATGVDEVTAKAYAENLETNLRTLLDRFKSGSYKAPPVRRTYIPKPDGRQRALGIPTFEDKVLQRAVLMVLEAIYEQDFLDCSYGFRPGRSAHMVLKKVWEWLQSHGGGFVLEVDIKSYFDTIDHARLREILDKRVRDGVIRRAIGKWLNAGVLEAGELTRSKEGTPQGGVVSPLLANVYLHEVLDLWFEEEIKPRLEGEAMLVRYADDFAIAFTRESDARRVEAVLPKRFAKYGLTLHETKTRMIDFRRPDRQRRSGEAKNAMDKEENLPTSFDLLGFTHYWSKSLRGYWVVKQKTAKKRLSRALTTIYEWCRRHRHALLQWQHQKLHAKMRGHYQYYGITGNHDSLAQFYRVVRRIWFKWLSRRTQRRSKRRLTWEKYARLLQRHPLPPPVAVHSTLRRSAKP